jgi:hypothetical protein
MKQVKGSLTVVDSIQHDRASVAGAGAEVDLSGYDTALAVLDVIALGGTSPSVTYQLEHSDDGTTFTAVPADQLQGAQPGAITSAPTMVAIGYVGANRYLRWRLVSITGTSPTVTAVGYVIRGAARHQPADQVQV